MRYAWVSRSALTRTEVTRPVGTGVVCIAQDGKVGRAVRRSASAGSDQAGRRGDGMCRTEVGRPVDVARAVGRGIGMGSQAGDVVVGDDQARRYETVGIG
jgi:hypothetical protein